MSCVSFENGFPVPTTLLEAEWIDRLTLRHDDGSEDRPLFPACCHKRGLLFVGLNPAPAKKEQGMQFYSRYSKYDHGYYPGAVVPNPPPPLHPHFRRYPLVRDEVARLLGINPEELPWSHLDAMMVRTRGQAQLEQWIEGVNGINGHLPETVEQLKLARALIKFLEPKAVIICNVLAAKLLTAWSWTLPGIQPVVNPLLNALNNTLANIRLPVEQAQPVGPNNLNLGATARWVILDDKRVPLFINAPLSTRNCLDNGSLQQLTFDIARAL